MEDELPFQEGEITETKKQAYQDLASLEAIQFQLEPGDILYEMKESLEALKTSPELMNSLLVISRSVVNRNTHLSNYDENNINEALFDIRISAILSIAEDATKLGISYSIPQMENIYVSYMNMITSSLFRPKNQGERRFLAKIEEHKIIQQKDPQKKGSILNPFQWGGINKKEDG